MKPPANLPPKRRIITYYLIVMAIILLINFLLFPSGNQKTVVDLPYSEFLTMVQGGLVKDVELKDNYILFTSKSESDNNVVMRTGRVPDSALVSTLYEHGVEFKTEIPQEISPIVSILLTWILPLVLMAGIGVFMMRQVSKNMGGGAMSFGKSNAKVYVAAQTGISFNDVAGEDEAKAALKEIVDFLHQPEKYKQIGARLPKGALLVGPPGTGKTLLAKAVAGEANVPFFSISGSEFVVMFVGMGAARVRDLFKQAQDKAPCIVFIDEIDAVGKTRDLGRGLGGNDEREQTLNQLLTEMDGFDGSKGVVILAATNRPESLDQALLRPGRFDRRIPVELPDLAGREAILRVHARKVTMADGVDYRAIALATSGTSGAELANIINEGALLAVKEGRSRVEQRDLEEAIETVLAGYQRKNAVISSQEKKVISYHEIGHALVSARQKSAAPVHKITIIPRTSGALGYTMQVDEDEHYLMTRDELVKKITTLTAGRAAEELIFHQVTSGAANDIEQATKLARTMITRLGMSEEFGMTALATMNSLYLTGGDTSIACSEQTAARVDDAVMALIQECHQRATEILEADQEKLHELAAFLMEKETITGEEFLSILEPSVKPEAQEDHDVSDQSGDAAERPSEEATEEKSAEEI